MQDTMDCIWYTLTFWGGYCAKRMKREKEHSAQTVCDLYKPLGEEPRKKMCLEFQRREDK